MVAELAGTHGDARLFVPALVDFDRTGRDDPLPPVGAENHCHLGRFAGKRLDLHRAVSRMT